MIFRAEQCNRGLSRQAGKIYEEVMESVLVCSWRDGGSNCYAISQKIQPVVEALGDEVDPFCPILPSRNLFFHDVSGGSPGQFMTSLVLFRRKRRNDSSGTSGSVVTVQSNFGQRLISMRIWIDGTLM